MVFIMEVQQINFKYCFSVDTFKNNSGERFSSGDINTWCGQNCKNQWIIINPQNSSFKCYCSPSVKTSYNGENFPLSSLQINASFLIMFEDENDAAFFKLTWLK